MVEVLNAIYEVDFLGFSYGFRPRRSPHHALDALAVGILRKKVNWVLDADIRDFFNTIDHGWLVKFVEHRIADRRILRLIQKWLSAGVMEEGRWTASKQGSPQGATRALPTEWKTSPGEAGSLALHFGGEPSTAGRSGRAEAHPRALSG
ncbi:reverse transcriptase domain-containing protein [Sorangium sp. So ce118]